MNIFFLLKCFIITVEEGTFTGAAKKLCVSKSLVSKNVKNLETYLNTRLMNRTTTALSLTDSGRSYYQEASVLIKRFDSLNQSIRYTSESMSGTINILAPNGLTELLFMPFICEFSKKYPDITMNFLLNDEIDQGKIAL